VPTAKPFTGKKKKKAVKAVKVEDLDLDPDAWPKFEKLIRDAAKGVLPPLKSPPLARSAP
jgi:hypothetical protein